ncbi:hypothetical protein HOO68_02340 [Candidatus Gracilibacteria bacterium]|nr:hypothetical protein [Candidatus Gracilibacteria bacterium]
MENTIRQTTLSLDEIQVLGATLISTGFESRIDEIVSRINTLEGIDAIKSMLQIPSQNIPQWTEKKRLVLFLVKKILSNR